MSIIHREYVPRQVVESAHKFRDFLVDLGRLGINPEHPPKLLRTWETMSPKEKAAMRREYAGRKRSNKPNEVR